LAERNKPKARPPLACEITAEHVVAARVNAAHDAVESVAVKPFAAGAVAPNLLNANVTNGDALRQAISDAFTTVGTHSRDVAVVLPDAAVRVVLLDFDALPDRAQDALPIVRFRLKRVLPFDVERAAISYERQATNGVVQVLAAVAQSSVLEEYEQAFRDIGFSPGVVLPSILAALGPVEGSEPTLVIKAEPGTLALAIVDQGELRLVRTIEDVQTADLTGERLAEDIYASLVFFQDTYGTGVQRVLLGGSVQLSRVRGPLEQAIGIDVQELVTSAYLGASFSGDSLPRAALAGVVGALIAR
jgi:type IV pilus assembly protein PilM